jgi:hypothetical protein
MTRKTLSASLASLMLLLSVGTSFAATATARSAVNIRSDPELGDNIVGTLRAGQRVDVIECEGGWCETEDGYVSQSYLRFGGGGGSSASDDDDDDDEDEIDDDDDDTPSAYDAEEGEFDDDPLGLEESVPESIHDGPDDDDDDDGDD